MYIGSNCGRLVEENQQLKNKIAIYESDDAVSQMKVLCDKRVKAASEREKRNYDCWMNAVEANKDLKKRNTALWQENNKYKAEVSFLKNKTESLTKLSDRRKKVIGNLQKERDELKAYKVEQDKQIEALKEELCKLKAQIDHDGMTNGIPTSQTPMEKKKVIPNTRVSSGLKKGAQKGHEKRCMKGFEEDEVTEAEDHELDVCPFCGGELKEAGDPVIKDEADYEIKIIKKRHRYHKYQCQNCGKEVRAKIPQRLKEQNQYGPAIQAMALALVDLGFVSVARAQEIAAGILHKKLEPSVGYVGKVQKKAARMLKAFLEEVKEYCLDQRILYWDDTVIFMNTARACFRFYGNESVAYYRAHATKGAEGLEEDGILSSLTEKTYLMHDHVKYNYRKEFLFKNIECIQHMERELERVYRASQHKWAKDLKTLIQEMIHKRKENLKQRKNSFTDEETNCFEEKLENLLIQAHREQNEEKNRYFSTDEKNAIKKLEEYKENYFAWIYDFTLPTTNNVSESGLRMTKTKQKVSGQFLKVETAEEFAAVRTYTETCRKNGVNEYGALERLMAGNPYTLKEILESKK